MTRALIEPVAAGPDPAPAPGRSARYSVPYPEPPNEARRSLAAGLRSKRSARASISCRIKSAALDTDDKFSQTFAAPGEYEYFCSIHPYMTGKIVVKADAKLSSN
jgi:hypothetical protein